MFAQESSVLLGALVQLSCCTVDGQRLLSTEKVAGVGQTLVRVLTRCRHRGAIEGCSVGFQLYCSQLLISTDQYLHDIPQQLLNQVLARTALLYYCLASSIQLPASIFLALELGRCFSAGARTVIA